MDEANRSAKFPVGAVAGALVTLAVVGVAWAGMNRRVESNRPAPAETSPGAGVSAQRLPPGHPPLDGQAAHPPALHPPALHPPAAHPSAGAHLGPPHPGHPHPGIAPGGLAAGPSIKGTVTEVLQVPGYTYLRLEDELGEMWAAVPTVELQPGANVAIASALPMENFHSKTLQRSFPKIYFGALAR